MVARRDIRGRNDERRAFLARFLLVAMSVGSGAECPSHSPFCRSIFFLTHTFRGTPLAHLNHFLGMLSPHIISREVFATCVFEDDVLAHVNTHRSGAVDHIFNKIQPRRSVWRGDPCVKRTEVPVPPRCFPRQVSHTRDYCNQFRCQSDEPNYREATANQPVANRWWYICHHHADNQPSDHGEIGSFPGCLLATDFRRQLQCLRRSVRRHLSKPRLG